jgi:5-methylthioadenosine/S-adenosylhomocysteine deaminase
MDDAGTEFARANVLIDGPRIAGIGPDLEFPDATGEVHDIRGRDHLVMPGLINGHFHSPVNLMKGSLDSLPLEMFMLYESPSLGDLMAGRREAYVRTMLGAIEMLKTGVTALQDDAFFVPVPTPDAIDGVMQAYGDSGIRATVALDQTDVVEYAKFPFLENLLPEALRRQMDNDPLLGREALLELYGYLIERWNGQAQGRLGVAVSCSAPQRVTVEYFRALDDLSRRHDLPFYMHILETKLQRVLGDEKYGQSLVKYVDDLGLLHDRSTVIHAIWVDESDIEILAQRRVTVAHNPVCNLRLGSGVMPFRKLRNRNVPVCLGSDEAIADDTINMWASAKMAGLIHNITEPDYHNWPRAEEVLGCLIRGGARAMRRADRIGILAPGYEADLIMLDLQTLAFTPLNDLKRQLVYCENGSSVRLTMVAGEIVVRDGRVLTVDENAIRAEARDIAGHQAAVIQKVRRNADLLAPYYRDMYLRAARRDVGINRWVGDAWRPG